MKKSIFVIQKHQAKTLHFDFRLQLDLVLKSWAVPKGLSLEENEKRLAVETEDHALSWADFEGEIPQGEYGAGLVEIFDRGFFENIKTDAEGKTIPLSQCLEKGLLEIHLEGKKVKGDYAMVRFKEKQWLLFKMIHKNG